MRWWWDPLSTRPTRWVNWIFIVLVHWNNSPRLDMSLHLDTLFCFRANQFLLFLLNAACLATNTNFIVFGLTRPGLKPTIYCTRGEHISKPRSTALEASTFRTHDLPHSRRVRYLLRDRSGFQRHRGNSYKCGRFSQSTSLSVLLCYLLQTRICIQSSV